ncbi:translocation/assembly module TamB domain-containing protein [Streptobacillus notomytis]|uniref:translocation/assembly module TamB domain-containing protein n=1 Tax=Streptobacillus notomytis TaxID=1712031 RepID=UPI00093640F2|nr:translocation/assembly module TamB domain-containing protein [Streptobacillus notomytis]
MKIVKRSLSFILPISLVIAGAKVYINSEVFKGHLKLLLNNVFEIKVDYSDLKLYGFSNLEIKNLRLRTQDGIEVIAADLVRAKINLFTPTRISDVELIKGRIVFERGLNGINLRKILPASNTTDYRRLSSTNRVRFKDVSLKYIDKSFGSVIEKEFKDVNGYLISILQTSLDLVAYAKTDNKEKFGINIKLDSDQRRNIFDLFSIKKYDDYYKEKIKLKFDFDNVGLTKKLFQYVPISNIASVHSGKVNGSLLIKENDDENFEFYGNLLINNADVWYREYNGIVKNVNANVKFNKYDIDLDGKGKIDDGNIDLGIRFNINNNRLNVKTSIDNVYYSTLRKYSLVNNIGLDGKSDKVKVDIDLGLRIKEDDFDIEKFNGKVNTKYLNVFDSDINNFNLHFKLKEKNVINIKTQNMAFNKNVNENLNIKALLNANFNLNVKNISGSGNFAIDNKSKFVNLGRINGSVEVKENKDILVNFNEKKIFGNMKYLNEKKEVKLNVNNRAAVNVKYMENDVNIKPKINNLTYSLKKNDFIYGALDIQARSNDGKYFNDVNAKLNINKSRYNVDAFARIDDGNIRVKGNSYKKMKYDYTLTANNFDMVKYLKKIGVNNLSELDGNKESFTAKISVHNSNDKVKLSLDLNNPVNIKFRDRLLGIKPELKDLVYNFKDGIVESGAMNLGVIGDGNIFDNITTGISVNNGNLDISSIVSVKDGKLVFNGKTNKDLIHSYDIKGEKIDIFEIGKLFGYIDKDVKESMKINFETKVSGNIDDIKGDIYITSPYGGYIAEYENLVLKGKINNLKEIDLDLDLSVDELWIKYQRFVDIKSKVKIRKEDIFVEEFGNDNLKLKAKYNLKTRNVNLESNLNAYNIYSTFGPDIDLLVNNMKFNVYGNLDNLNGNISIDKSPVMLNKKKISDFVMNGNIVNNKINLDRMKIRDNNISGYFDIKNKNYDINIKLKENNIEELVDIHDLKLNVDSNLNIKGNLDKTDITGNLDIYNLSYKEYRIPKVFLDINHKDTSIFNIMKTGVLNINNFEIKDKENKEVFKFKDSFDLANLDVDYNIQNKEIDLGKISLLNHETYKGKLILDLILRHNKEETLVSLNVKSDELLLNSLKVTDVYFDIQGNDKVMNISGAYLEYENNPFLLDGYASYMLDDYNFNLLANDFNLKFLEISDKIKKSSGIANLNLSLKKNLVQGKIDMNNFSLETFDDIANLNKINANIDLKNKTISINDLSGNANGGNFSVLGKFDLPEISDDFLTSKKIKTGSIEVDTKIDNVNLKYAGNNLRITSDINIENNKIFGNVILNNGNIVNISPFLSSSRKSKNKLTNVNDYFTELKNQIIKNIINQHILDVSLETEKDININIPSVVGLVKDVKGNAFGNARVLFDRSNLSIYSDLSVNKGEFVLNGHIFKVEDAVVKFIGNLDPIIEFKASTHVGEDVISIKITGSLNNRTIELSSEQGKDTNEILGIIALNEEGGLLDVDKIKTTNIVGKALSSALNNLLFSTFTNKVSSTLGINDFKIKANFDSKNNLEFKDIINNTTTTFYINNQFFNLNNLYWNAELTVPFDLKIDRIKNELKYNLWLNYFLKKGISATAGIKNPIDVTNNKARTATFYTGLQYDNRYGTFIEIIDDLSSLFKKKKYLKNEGKKENVVDKETNK